MLVFPPPFKRKCHPRCAKQILDFTFLLQIIKGGVVQGKFLGWFGDWCFRWIHAQGELEGLSTHLLIFLISISPLLTWMSIPFDCQQGKVAPPDGPSTFQRRPRPADQGLLSPGGWFQTHISANTSPNTPEGSHLLASWVILPSAKKGFIPFLKTLSNNWEKGKILMFPLTGGFNVSVQLLASLPTPSLHLRNCSYRKPE